MANDKIVTSKEVILKNIRKALLAKSESLPQQVDLDQEIYVHEAGDLSEVFSGNFISNNGTFLYCFNKYDFVDQFLLLVESRGWLELRTYNESIQSLFKEVDFPFENTALHDVEVGITLCDALIARTGSIIVNTENNLSRVISIYPPVHIVLAYSDQIYYDLKDYFASEHYNQVKAKSSMVSIISGPSRTADIEKTLVLGAHGPKELYVFYIDQSHHN
ncbi:MAG: LUD domain-containing protein [Bacteroidota bacterium]|nr:LUD domain-containing protein [Bacteroidota bacterium]